MHGHRWVRVARCFASISTVLAADTAAGLSGLATIFARLASAFVNRAVWCSLHKADVDCHSCAFGFTACHGGGYEHSDLSLAGECIPCLRFD